MGRRTVHHKEDLTTGELISGWEVRELLRLVGAETCFIAAHTTIQMVKLEMSLGMNR